VSWFKYSDQKKRSNLKNVWLRIRDLPEELKKEIDSNISNEKLERVVVCELLPDNNVLLECWAEVIFGVKYTVFYITTKEDPDWICEGDLGRGYVGASH